MLFSKVYSLGVLAGLMVTLATVQAADLAPSGGKKMMAVPLSGSIMEEGRALTDDLAKVEAMVKANPEDPEAYFLLGVAYSRTPYLERSLDALQKARRLARKHPEGYRLFDKKIVEYEKMHAADPDNPLLLYRMGFGYYFRGYAAQYGYIKDADQPADMFYSKAEKAMRRVVELVPNDTAARDYLGFFLVEQNPEKNLNEAIALWEESLRIDPGDPGAYMLLGQYYMKTGDLRKAVEYSTKALKIRNEWLKAHSIDEKYTFGRY